MSGVRAYLELSRVSNLPTCVTNVLVGAAIGAGAGPLPWPTVARVAIGVVLLYVGGMALNDVVDAGLDARRRPGRPIPAGRISRTAAGVYAAAALVAGLIIIAAAGGPVGWALGLVAAIVLYDLLHHVLPPSLVLMGVIRGLVYLVAAAAVDPAFDVIRAGAIATAMTLYIVILTLLARREHRAERPGGAALAWAMPAVVLFCAVAVPPAQWPWALVTGALLVAWLATSHRLLRAVPPRVPVAVMRWLAGICLADAWFLALLDRPMLIPIAVACFALTTLAHRRIEGS